MPDTLTTGQCLCGKVTFTVTGQPARAAQCHCKDCQRASGTGHMSLAFFKEDQVTIEGETVEYASVADSGNTNYRRFCGTCGSRMFGRNSAREGVIAVTVGSCDDNSWFEPQAVVYCKDREAWDTTRTDIPNFDAMPG